MSWVNPFWTSLSARQKWVLGTLGGWFGAWAIGKLADDVSRRFPLWMLPAVIAKFIHDYVLNAYVLGFLAGATAIGFGPTIWAYFKRQERSAIFMALFTLASLSFSGYVVYSFASDYYSRRQEELISKLREPKLIDPPKAFTRNGDGSHRVFLRMTPEQIHMVYVQNTEIQAKEILKREVAKWFAVTGAVSNISLEDTYSSKQLNVWLQEGRPPLGFFLTFEMSASGKIAKQPKKSRITAVCRITRLSDSYIGGEACELVDISSGR